MTPRNLIRLALLVGLWLFAATPTQGAECSSNCSVSVGQRFVALTDVLADGTSYQLAVDGVATSLQGRIVNGLIEFDHPGFTTKGVRALEIRVLVNGQWVVLTEITTVSVTRRPIKIRT